MVKLNPIPFIRSAAKNSPWLVIAIALHAAIIAVLSLIYIAGGLEKSNDTPTNVSLNQAKLPPVELPEERIDRKQPPKNADEEVVDYEHDIQYVPSEEPEDLSLEVGVNTEDGAPGETGGTAIGAGAGPGHFSTGRPSAFVSRRAGGGGEKGRPPGHTQATEKAVREGLLWLIRHQQPDGSWDATALPAMCKEGSPCVAEGVKYPEFWRDGVTGLSLLAFLGAGYNFDSRQNMVDTVNAKRHHLGDVIKRGLTWLKDKQQADGSFGPDQHVYNQALCALALSEAYGLSGIRHWKAPAQKAIDWLVAAQKLNPNGDGTLWGWRYHSRVAVVAYKETIEAQKAELDAKKAPLELAQEELRNKSKALEEQKATMKAPDYASALEDIKAQSREIDGQLKALEPEAHRISVELAAATNEIYDSDLSVTTWVIMAFKSASASGLNVPDEAYQGGMRFVQSTSTAEGLAGYQHSNQAGRTINGPGDQFDYHTGTMSSLAMLCRTFIDHNIEDPFLEKAAKLLVKDAPEISKNKLSIDYYYWYYGSLALNQFDGPDSPRSGNKYWDAWKRAMEDAVLGTQNDVEKTCTRGGWVTGDRWALQGGPIYSTAINVLTLEVYYRYPNAFASGTRFDPNAKPTPPTEPAEPVEPPEDGEKPEKDN